MRILSESILRDRYDVIVVGAGLGGMTTASLLAKRGLSVLMIDQQSKPGGSCTSFKREDVVYDVGTAMIYGFGNKGFKPFRFILNELEEPTEIVAHPTLARLTFEGKPIVFWPRVEQFLQELVSLFPEEEKGIHAFYRDLYKMYENIVTKNEVIVPPSEFSPRQGLRSLMSSGLGIFKMQKLLTTSVKDLLDRYFSTEPIIDFYDKLCSAYCYCTAAETPAVLAATMFLDNHIGGVYYPAGGAQMLPNKIEKAFERYGGQVVYRQFVDEVLIRDGAAYGVRLSNGVEILADNIVLNATVWNIYGKLVRPEHIAPERLRWAQSLVPTFPSMTLYMVVGRDAIPPGALPWEIFIENREVIDSSDLTLYINSLVDETLCPTGDLVIMAIAPNLCQWPSPRDPGYRSAEYQTQKQGEADRMLNQIEQHYPGFRQHIKTLIVGTPTTIERFLLKNGGAVGGPKNMLGQQMLNRLHARSEWKNLYFCGDSTVMGTGAPATAVSGVGAANVLLRDLHLPDYDAHQFPRQYIHFVDLPYKRPAYRHGDALTAENAWLAAAQCQWCEDPECVKHCPAGIDIPGFLRRMEAENYTGAARLVREQNPLAEICGYACAADTLCQGYCYRKDFGGASVHIAELHRWVCETAGEEGWIKARAADGPSVAVIGSSPAGLTCAYYLRLTGCQVDLYDSAEQPGGRLLQGFSRQPLVKPAIERDLKDILGVGIEWRGGRELALQDIQELIQSHDAVYLASGLTNLGAGGAASKMGMEAWPGLYIGNNSRQTVVEGVAEGRRAARDMSQYLYAERK